MEMKIGKKQIAFYGVKGYWNYLTEPNREGQFTTQIVITEEMADEIEEKFNKKPTNLAMKNKQEVKNAKKADRTPVMFEGSDDDYVLNLTQTSTWPSGDPRQISVSLEGKAFTDGVGGGTVMNILCNTAMTSKGLGMYLDKVGIVDLVEAEFSTGGGEDEFEGFDEVDMGAPKPPAKSSSDFEDDDDPFA